jgi:hypothetical protein
MRSCDGYPNKTWYFQKTSGIFIFSDMRHGREYKLLTRRLSINLCLQCKIFNSLCLDLRLPEILKNDPLKKLLCFEGVGKKER